MSACGQSDARKQLPVCVYNGRRWGNNVCFYVGCFNSSMKCAPLGLFEKGRSKTPVFVTVIIISIIPRFPHRAFSVWTVSFSCGQNYQHASAYE